MPGCSRARGGTRQGPGHRVSELPAHVGLVGAPSLPAGPRTLSHCSPCSRTPPRCPPVSSACAHGRPHRKLPPGQRPHYSRTCPARAASPLPTWHLRATSGCACLGASATAPPRGSWHVAHGRQLSFEAPACPQKRPSAAPRGQQKPVPEPSESPSSGFQWLCEDFQGPLFLLPLPTLAPAPGRWAGGTRLTLPQLRLWGSLGSCFCAGDPPGSSSTRPSMGNSQPGPILALLPAARWTPRLNVPAHQPCVGVRPACSREPAWWANGREGAWGPPSPHGGPALPLALGAAQLLSRDAPKMETMMFSRSPPGPPVTICPLEPLHLAGRLLGLLS